MPRILSWVRGTPLRKFKDPGISRDLFPDIHTKTCDGIRSDMDSSRHGVFVNIDIVAQHATISRMIKSFKHKGLQQFFEKGTKKGIQAAHASKLRMQLAALDTAHNIEDLDIPGYRLHQLKGQQKNLWSITVNGNWRVTFEFSAGHVYIANYEDYH